MSSPSSSRESSPEAAVSDAEAAARLAQLEKLLQSSLGYADAGAGEEQAEQPPKKKRKKGKPNVPVVAPAPAPAESIQVDEDEVVAFRLFSTQKTPQAVVIREKEGWDAVRDPRIRDAADEPRSVWEQRMQDIASIAVDGSSLVSNATLEPLTMLAGRVTTRKLTSRASLPTLAYLNAVLPSLDASAPLPPRLEQIRKKAAPTLPAKGPPARVQLVRRPLERLADVKLELVTLLKAGSNSAKEGKAKRVSKSRRAAAHRRAVAPMK